MRYGVISDIHSNLEAMEAVMHAMSGKSIDAYLFLGDIVGYGADPRETIRAVRSLDPCMCVAGNHDRGATGLLDPENFNEYAKEAILWTRNTLKQGDIDYLNSLRLLHEEKDFTLVHGSLEEPAEFNYVLEKDDARLTIQRMQTRLCFVGHSHKAGTFYSDGVTVAYTADRKIKLEGRNKYVVNAGSVGQPRDGDARAAFIVYDTKEDTIEIHRIGYDIESAGRKILKAGLPEISALRLSQGV